MINNPIRVHRPLGSGILQEAQVLIIEELARNGVECRFIKAPSQDTPEDRLVVQFQGMIAEYERAQILERSRRGKRHRALRGEVSILSGAPYGYRYHKKTAESDAWYEVIEPQASVVRDIYKCYTVDHMSIGAIAHTLNQRAVPTCKGGACWERSVVWAILRNPAYKGKASYGKTRTAPRQRVTRPLRQRGGIAKRNSANHERPRQGVDRDPGAIHHQRNDLCSCRGETGTEQAMVQTPYQDTKPPAGPGVVQQMWLCISIAHQPERAPARSITCVVWGPTPGATSMDRCATTVRCARICSMRSSGPKSSACLRIPP